MEHRRDERYEVGRITFAPHTQLGHFTSRSRIASLHFKRDIRELLGPENGISCWTSDGDVTVSGVIPHQKMTEKVRAALIALGEAINDANKEAGDD